MNYDAHTHTTQHAPHWPTCRPRLLVPIQQAHRTPRPFQDPRQVRPAHQGPRAERQNGSRPVTSQSDLAARDRAEADANFRYLLAQVEHLKWPVPERDWVKAYQATLCRIFGEPAGTFMIGLLNIVSQKAQAKQARMN
jgi:hypothetical protein